MVTQGLGDKERGSEVAIGHFWQNCNANPPHCHWQSHQIALNITWGISAREGGEQLGLNDGFKGLQEWTDVGYGAGEEGPSTREAVGEG